MTVVLDGQYLSDRLTAHDYLKEQLQLPNYYGKNLDALYDLLTERGVTTEIQLIHSSQLNDCGRRIINTIMDCAKNNPAITFQEKDC